MINEDKESHFPQSLDRFVEQLEQRDLVSFKTF